MQYGLSCPIQYCGQSDDVMNFWWRVGRLTISITAKPPSPHSEQIQQGSRADYGLTEGTCRGGQFVCEAGVGEPLLTLLS